MSDGMGYDGEEIRRPRWWVLGLVVFGVLLAAVVVVGAWAVKAPPLTPEDSVPGLTSPTPTVEEAGRDNHDEATAAPSPVWAAFEAFMGAWTSTDAETRAGVFAEVATPDLAAGLAVTDPQRVVTASRSKVEVVGAGEYSAELRAWFDGRDRPVSVLLVADPGSRYGWRVVSVGEAR